jgi:hypothetical protein
MDRYSRVRDEPLIVLKIIQSFLIFFLLRCYKKGLPIYSKLTGQPFCKCYRGYWQPLANLLRGVRGYQQVSLVKLEITHPRVELYKKSPIYSLPKLWNELDDTRFQQCRTTFSISIKDKLLQKPKFLQ